MARRLAAARLGGGAAWGYGRFATPVARPAVRTGARLAVVGLAAGAFALALTPGVGTVSTPGSHDAPAAPRTSDAAALAADGRTWHAWSPTRVDALRRAGRPVFVDFTADWCLSCKVNERVALVDADVARGFTAHGVVLLRADWTRGDPAITRTLAEHGRDGVPLYLLYPAGVGAPAAVLPALLTPGAVRHALEPLAVAR